MIMVDNTIAPLFKYQNSFIKFLSDFVPLMYQDEEQIGNNNLLADSTSDKFVSSCSISGFNNSNFTKNYEKLWGMTFHPNHAFLYFMLNRPII